MESELLADFDILLRQAIAEDLGGRGDITSEAVFAEQQNRFRIICRQDGVVYGLWCVERIIRAIDSRITLELLVADGQAVARGQIICRFQGAVAAILKAERIILNFLGYLSGIATVTAAFVDSARGKGNTKILDTRKTLPGYRRLAKAAVLAGGGSNHRMGLYDMVMLKDNHIDAAGSINQAVDMVRRCWGYEFPIEIECRSLADVEQALQLNVERIMLDNMNVDQCVQAVSLRNRQFPNSKAEFEASGDMCIDKIEKFAGIGLEYISVGALTHSVPSFNFSLGLEVNELG
jgi:nicotinate-nucleotide pyrophosphorylase (carboxylating)